MMLCWGDRVSQTEMKTCSQKYSASVVSARYTPHILQTYSAHTPTLFSSCLCSISKQTAFSNQWPANIWVTLYYWTSLLAWTSLSRSQQFLWFYQKLSGKPQTSSTWKLLPCFPPSTQAQSASCYSISSTCLGSKGRGQAQSSWEAGCPNPLGFFGNPHWSLCWSVKPAAHTHV